MKAERLLTLAITSTLLITAGCRKTNTVDKGAFKSAINNYLGAHQECVWATTQKFPTQADTNNDDQTRGFDALTDAGLLTRQAAEKKRFLIGSKQVNMYDLSDKGRSTWTADQTQPGYGNFCFGHRAVTTIDTFSPARHRRSYPVHRQLPLRRSRCPRLGQHQRVEDRLPQNRHRQSQASKPQQQPSSNPPTAGRSAAFSPAPPTPHSPSKPASAAPVNTRCPILFAASPRKGGTRTSPEMRLSPTATHLIHYPQTRAPTCPPQTPTVSTPPPTPATPAPPEPSHAERTRTLLTAGSIATLSTQSRKHPGFPFGSLMPYALDSQGRPLLLISNMAMNTQNLKSDPHCSLFVAQPTSDEDPLGTARATLVAEAHPVPSQDLPAARESYLARHPTSRYWVDFTDFSFFRLNLVDLYYVGGFGVMGWVDAAGYQSAAPDPLLNSAPGILAHMNEDHVDSMILLAHAHLHLSATEATMTSVDRLGFTLKLKTTEGMKAGRINFPNEVTNPTQTRTALVDLVKAAKTPTPLNP